MPKVYEGNWPTNVSKDSKYSIRSENGTFVIGMEYRTLDGEKWYPTSDDHQPLVDMVNKVKTEIAGSPGGSFYINEYGQVIVPAGNPLIYYYAGDYRKELLFDFDGYQLSGKATGLDGRALSPGDPWEGPHQGIPYKLKAGAKDISFELTLGPRRKKEVLLSSHLSTHDTKAIVSKVASVIGYQGGRFYINEYRQMFTGLPYKYIGEVGAEEPWFPMPHQS